MTPKRTSAAETTPLRLVILSMDTHLASATARARAVLSREMPGLTLSLHAASEFAGHPAALARCKADIAAADIVVAGMLFLEDHFLPILEDLRARREHCDAMICLMSASEVVKLTRLGHFDMGKPASGPMALLKKLRGNKDKASTGGAAQMKMLRRIPQMLRFIPGTAQDVRAYFLTLQYWLGGSDENMVNLVRHVVDRGADGPRRVLRGLFKAAAPVEYPEVGVYHPRLAGRLGSDVAALPLPPRRRRAKARSASCCCARTCCPTTPSTMTASSLHSKRVACAWCRPSRPGSTRARPSTSTSCTTAV